MNRRTLILFPASVALLGQTPAGQKSAGRRVLILLGPPGAGKTTQANIIGGKYSLPVISAGELLKKSHGRKSDLSKRLKVQVDGGTLINDEGINHLMQVAIGHGDAYNGFVLDGYPANTAQAEFLAAQLKELGFPPPVVVHLTIPDSVAQERLRKRHRADDTPANIERRMAEYRDEEDSLLAYYPQMVKIDGTPDERAVTGAIEKVFNSPK